IWYAGFGTGQVGRVTPAGAVTTFPVSAPKAQPFGMATGPDGNVWFAAQANRIGRITPAGTVTEFALPTANSGVADITLAPDGNLWFTEHTGNRIGKITTAGAIQEFPLPTAGQPYRIAAGPDGNLWFTEFAGNKITRMTPDGRFREYPLPNARSGAYGITVGPDAAILAEYLSAAEKERLAAWEPYRSTGRQGQVTYTKG
ncbi:MAG: hypothetical protein ABR562_09605, partial [Thermoplasmatota archaeon]